MQPKNPWGVDAAYCKDLAGETGHTDIRKGIPGLSLMGKRDEHPTF